MSASALALALAVPATFIPTAGAHAQVAVEISVAVAPPALPDYDQPPLPASGYMWVPGYWAWDPDEQDYYWVPGSWVEPPEVGLLWTPPYWGWNDGVYVFHAGYWGQTVGFYGGVDYGYGYDGDGYEGGSWRGRQFFYNTVVNNIVNVHVTNVYTQNVIVRNTTKVSYNGGPGGVPAKPTPTQLAAVRGPHVAPTNQQLQNLHVAQKTPTLHLKANNGQPPIAAVAHPGVLSGPGVTAAHKLGVTTTGAPPIKPPPGMTNNALPTPLSAKKPLGLGATPQPGIAGAPLLPKGRHTPQQQLLSAPSSNGAPPHVGGTLHRPTFSNAGAPPRIDSLRHAPPTARFTPAPMEMKRYTPPQMETKHYTPPRMEMKRYAPPPTMGGGQPAPHIAAPRFNPPPMMGGGQPAPHMSVQHLAPPPHFAPPPHAAPHGPPPNCPDPKKCR